MSAIALIIVGLVIVAALHCYNGYKAAKRFEQCSNEQALVDDTPEAAVAVDVVDTPDARIKKVVKHQDQVPPDKPRKAKKAPRKTTKKKQ